LPTLSEQKKVRDIRYTSKDFDSIKSDLISFVKQNYPDSWSDFNEASGGMALLDLMAYIGDMMSFYIDRQVNESFINRAVEEKNIIANAKQLGYNPKVPTPAIVSLSISADVNNSISAESMFKILKGSRVRSRYNVNTTFEILEDVDFSSDTNRVISLSDSTLSMSKSGVSAIAGIQKTFRVSIGEASKFLKIKLPDSDITEIVSITGSDNSEWYQVDHLAQDAVFVGEENTSSSSGDIPFILKMKKIPRRYIIEREVGRLTSLTFGPGTYDYEDSEFIPNPEDYVQPHNLRGSPSGFSPSLISSDSFLSTRSLGLAPRNTDLTIKYRVGGGVDTNVGANVLNAFTNILFSYKNFALYLQEYSGIRNDIEKSIKVTNDTPAAGGKDAETFNEIRHNASAEFATQGRCVTLSDYQVRSMTMPSKFGSVFRSYARKDQTNNLGIELIVVSIDSYGKLTTTSNILKNNIETYLRHFKTISDTIRITDAKIVNIGIDFSIVPANNVNNNEALLKAIYLLQNEFSIKNSNLGAYIVKSQLISMLNALDSIIAVPKLEFINLYGTINNRTYSSNIFDMTGNTRKGILYFPKDTIYEVKYLQHDIVGAIE